MTLDKFTTDHLRKWLDAYEDAEVREQVGLEIAAALLADPEAIERGAGWPELRDRGHEILADARVGSGMCEARVARVRGGRRARPFGA
jgi:hypothetical protein